MAAQDFRHVLQQSAEPVSDYIRRLERTFRRAYGREMLSEETRDTVLYGQMQEGLYDSLMRSPAVSGARNYQELCLSARNEEKRQSELLKRQKYRVGNPVRAPIAKGPLMGRPNNDRPPGASGTRPASSSTPTRPSDNAKTARCWICEKVGHLSKDCPIKSKQESTGRMSKNPGTRMVTSDDPTLYLLDDGDDDVQVNQVRIQDHGSQPQCAQVLVGGVAMKGVVDSGSDITILGGEMFKKVASVARLHKKEFHPPDKTPGIMISNHLKLMDGSTLILSFRTKP